ncbi:MAG: 8-oxo-dGTP diphosphatase [Lachnospiraceae bacterium]|nr:8-oxo-dGTP diphosphatase [Lachnospiraceae bacterium]
MSDSRILTTLCYIEKEEQYLMMHRVSKKEDANAGKWIGVGGHFQPAESPDECLLREVWEETGLLLTSYRLRGIITFVSDEWGYEYMFLYTADGYEGSDHETDLSRCNEGVLKWIPKDKILDLNLWEGDRVFLKLLLENAGFFTLKLVYRGEELIEKELKV